MPVYNRELIVSVAIESILKQEYTHFELICINDGSSDDTESVLESYARSDNRVRVEKHPVNKGRSAARNTGIRSAKGDWLCFLDSDDIYFPNHLSTHANLIGSGKPYKCYATRQLVYGKPRKYPFKWTAKERLVTLNDLITDNFISLNQISIKKDIVPFFIPENISHSEDLLFLRRVLEYNDLLLVDNITTDVLFHKKRSVLADDIIYITTSNWAAALSFCADNQRKDINRKILSHTALFCTSRLLTKRKVARSWHYFSISLSNVNTYFSPLFYKVLLKYILIPFKK